MPENIDNTLVLPKDSKEDIQSAIDDFARYGVSIINAPSTASVISRGNRLLNTYPGLVKNNRDVFFPDGKIPEDALDDYEEDTHSDNYWTLKDLKEMGIPPEEWKEWKQEIAEGILAEQRKINEMHKKHDEQYRGADGNYDVARAMDDIFGE